MNVQSLKLSSHAKRSVFACLTLGGLSLASAAQADQFHYNNFIMGTRAVGLGGAFTAVADDASGIVYNPAGLAFSLSNDISGSANAFYNKKITYKNALGKENFVEKSGGSLPAFFGGLQKLDRFTPGLVAGFGIYTVDSDLKDQDDLYENFSTGSGVQVERYHRTSNARASTYFAGGAVALRFGGNFSLGFGLNYFNVDELTQNYQDVKTAGVTKNTTDGSLQDIVVVKTVADRESLVAYGVEPVLGMQIALPANMAFGLMIKKGIIVSQHYERSNETRQTVVTAENNEVLNSGEAAASTGVAQSLGSTKSKKPLGDWPMNVRLGLSWFATTKLMLSTDVSHFTASSGADKLGVPDRAPYQRDAVTNYAGGVEYYVVPSIPLRFGVFTNNDARPKLKKDKQNQPDHIDYIGETLFIAWVQPNSQIAAGVVLQQGSGEAQKLGGSDIQKITAEANTFGFSATHNF